MKQTVIQSVGGYLPDRCLTNADLEKMVDTSDSWIRERTGIRERRIAADNELTSDLAIVAAQEALSSAGVTGAGVDMVILATTTPDKTLPATAVKIQTAIGMTGGFAFDIQAACSGFVYALSLADNAIRSGMVRRALIVGAETLSRIVDWSDRNTCVLFGDGAGAVLLEGVETPDGVAKTGVLRTSLRSDGQFYDILTATGGVSFNQKTGTILMEGKEVFRQAIDCMSDIASCILTEEGLSQDDVDFFIPHQANVRIVDSVARKLNLSADKVILTLPYHGNTSAASIPLALWTGVRDGRIKRGNLLLLDAMGAGLTWGSALIRF